MAVHTLALAAPLRSEKGGQKGASAQMILTCPSEQPRRATRHRCRASTRTWHSCPTRLPGHPRWSSLDRTVTTSAPWQAARTESVSRNPPLPGLNLEGEGQEHMEKWI